MTYAIAGYNVTLELTAEEMHEVIVALELADADSDLLAVWYEFRKQEFGSGSGQEGRKPQKQGGTLYAVN